MTKIAIYKYFEKQLYNIKREPIKSEFVSFNHFMTNKYMTPPFKNILECRINVNCLKMCDVYTIIMFTFDVILLASIYSPVGLQQKQLPQPGAIVSFPCAYTKPG